MTTAIFFFVGLAFGFGFFTMLLGEKASEMQLKLAIVTLLLALIALLLHTGI